MKNKLIITGISVVVIALIGFATLPADADDSIGELQTRIHEIEASIEQAKEEWVTVAAEKADAQEWCNVTREREAQLRRLNELNNSRRAEVEILKQKLDRLTPEPR